MALLKSCCCWRSIRSGSFASGIYTMAFYTVVVIAGSFHVESIVNLPVLLPVLLTFSILTLIFAAISVLTSILLIVGLCTDNRVLLIPWIVSVSLTTILDIILSVYLVSDSDEIEPFFGVLVATDFLICALNVYCILCVASQYQEFSAARNQPRPFMNDNVMPVIEVEPPSINRLVPVNQPPIQNVVSVIPNDGTSVTGSTRHLLSTAGSSEFKPSGSPKLAACRASFSSTSEVSFSSTDTLAGRRDSTLPLQDVARPGLLSPVGEVKSLHDESLTSTEEDRIKSVCVDVENEESEIDNLSSPGVSRFTVSGLFSTNIFRQIPSTVSNLEQCDPEEHPLGIYVAPLPPERPSLE